MKQYVQKIRLEGQDNTGPAYEKAKKNARNFYRETLQQEKASRNAMRQSRAHVAQLGMQFQDIAVQLQGGQNPFFILAQQGSQIASIFGAKGAVVGAILAFAGAGLGALMPALFDTKDATDKLGDSLAKLDKVVKITKESTYELTEEMRGLAKQSAQLAQLKLKASLLEIQNAMNLAAEALRETTQEASGLDKAQINRLPKALKKVEESGLSLQEIMSRTGYIINAQFDRPVREAVLELSKTFNITQEEAYKLTKALSAFRENANPETVKNFAETISEIALSSGGTNTELVKLAEAVVDASYQFGEMGDRTKALQKFQEELAKHGFFVSTKATKESTAAIKESQAAMMDYMGLRNRYLNQDQTLYKLQVDLAKAREEMDFDLEAAIKKRIELHKKEIAAKDADAEAKRIRELIASQRQAMNAQSERTKLLLDGRSATKKMADESARLIQVIGMGRSMDTWDSAEIEAYRVAMEKLNEQLFKVKDITPEVTKVTNEAEDAYFDVSRALKEFSNSTLSSVEDNLVSMINGTVSAKNAFKNMAASIINDMIRMQVQSQYMPLVKTALSSIVGSVATAYTYGTNVGSEQTAMLAAQDAGLRANGGPVSANKPYIVGERGPELMIPNGAGNVIPNNSLGGGGDTYNISLNVSTGVSQTVREEMREMLPKITESAKAAVLSAKLRGGAFSSAF